MEVRHVVCNIDNYSVSQPGGHDHFNDHQLNINGRQKYIFSWKNFFAKKINIHLADRDGKKIEKHWY